MLPIYAVTICFLSQCNTNLCNEVVIDMDATRNLNYRRLQPHYHSCQHAAANLRVLTNCYVHTRLALLNDPGGHTLRVVFSVDPQLRPSPQSASYVLSIPRGLSLPERLVFFVIWGGSPPDLLPIRLNCV
jgi:hypothetical protein